jgi:hypothetical protein
MRNKKHWLGILALMLVFGIMLSGCASRLGHGNFYSSEPFTFAEKRGEESNSIMFGIFGSGYPRVEEVAKKYNITKINTVEHYYWHGFLFLWTRYTTIVTGE